MKLVEILAKELIEWKEDAHIAMQDNDSDKTIWFLEKDHEFVAHDGFEWKCDSYFKIMISRPSCLATDYKDAIVTRAQWQAERDRQKGGEWKRHRGGAKPVSVSDGDMVEARLRCGDTQTAYAGKFLWSHADCDHSVNITKYRVIRQPQAEEVPIIADGDTREYKGPFPCAPEGEPLNQLEWDIQFPSGVCSVQAKTEQMETPFKWRDEVTELNAYIEKYTRERDALIERLASEGFALIPPVVSVVSEFSGVQQIIPFEEWTDGDIVRCIDTGLSCADLTLGNEYTVVTRRGETGVIDDEGDHMRSCIDVGELEFVRRP